MSREPVQPIELWPGKAPGSDVKDDFRPTLELYPVETDKPLGAVLVCPGGGYGGRAPHEASPVARRFNSEGFHGFVVQYRVAPHRHPAPLFDVARAIRLVRHNSREWHVDPQRVAVLGFSAGGHLAASLGVHYAIATPEPPDEIDRVNCRPDALILCYPVISSAEFGHQGSIDNLLGPGAPDEMRRKVSLEFHVTEKTPPAFLWHTAEDGAVPVENSLAFARALRSRGVPFELHVYPHGSHGLGLAPDQPHIATWASLCAQWLREMGF